MILHKRFSKLEVLHSNMRLNIESGNWSLSVKLYIKSFSQCFDFLWLKPTKRQENAAVSCFHIWQLKCPEKQHIYKLMSFTPAGRQIFGCLRTKPVPPLFPILIQTLIYRWDGQKENRWLSPEEHSFGFRKLLKDSHDSQILEVCHKSYQC